ncbi:D-alanine--D-alanine ligase OS=Leifsonia shinshuensis OX=150026 GN=ddl PE=3 SV=1 [Leifsonia shinshuensis]
MVAADGTRSTLGAVDVVFPILHGPWGEDGTVQGMLELVGLPYVGSGVLASALGMDKHFTKTVLQQAGIPVAPWRTVTAYEWRTDADAVRREAEALGLPAFVKPARAGSSVGVSKVTSWDDLGAAVETALAEDDRVLIESAVVGREVEIAVLGGRPGEPARGSVAGEIVISGREFYDFAAKYLDAPGIDLVCPADLTDAELAEMRELGVRAFDAIGAEGLSRVDFFLTADGFVVNEINTMPGFTPISMFPRCWQESGLAYPALITELLEVALARA